MVSLNNKSQSPWSNTVVQATKLAPSIWPIIFAAVLGNAIKCFARWKAERGSRLLSLEQLTNSQTFGSTIGTIFVLRIFGLYTVCLMVLWAFNPLGSQASFRGVYLKERFGDGFRNITIVGPLMWAQGSNRRSSLDSDAVANVVWSTAFECIESSTQYVDRESGAFRAVVARLGGLSSASRSTSMDPWGNAKFPDPKLLPGYDATDTEKWLEVPSGGVTNFVSLIGIPVSGIPITSKEKLTIILSIPVETLACSSWQSLELPELLPNLNFFSNSRADYLSSLGYPYAPFNVSPDMQRWLAENYKRLAVHYNSEYDRPPWKKAVQSLFLESSLFMDTTLPFSNAWETNVKRMPQRSVVFGSWGNKSIDITSCAVSAQYLTAKIKCESYNSTAKTQCNVVAVKRMRDPPTISNYTSLGRATTGRNLMIDLPLVASKMGLGNDRELNRSSPIEMYLADPATSFQTDGTAIQLSETPIEVFQDRMGLLVNSFILAARYPTLIMGREELSGKDVSVQTVTKRFSTAPSYALDGPWMAMFFVANLVMLGAALAALAFKLSCRGPEVMGYVSSLTRESPYFSDYEGISSTSDAADRSRAMGNLRVRVGDVQVGKDMGRIAFAPVFGSDTIKKGRHYE